jgi:hypothetical protein
MPINKMEVNSDTSNHSSDSMKSRNFWKCVGTVGFTYIFMCDQVCDTAAMETSEQYLRSMSTRNAAYATPASMRQHILSMRLERRRRKGIKCDLKLNVY